MHRLLAVLLVMGLTLPLWAAEELKPNTLTPKEIAEGWILLFDGETNFNWGPKDSAKFIKAEKGELLLGSDQRFVAGPKIELNHFELCFEYRVVRGNDRKFFVLQFGNSYGRKELPIPDRSDEWRTVHFKRDGDRFTGSLRIRNKEQENWWGGVLEPASFRPMLYMREDIQVALRNVKVKPLRMKSLFNGKDLTGWKEFPGKKSKFTVTKEGWLNIKDGPGDLQTTGQWADFVLQLECRTNGDNLNSGVFFRCIPGQYQQGYEAQIQNQHAKKAKSYTIEEYDPKTHELKDKKKIENWSQDYGTGAIYRRIPARRALAKDREWFTMTVVVHNRHMATWVNGLQMVDWDDNRPANENARNGFRREKGAISLQGHDPTTDLSFRNIRLAAPDEKD